MAESATSENRPRLFPVTQWTVVLAAGGTPSPESTAALERLCSSYWYPLYAFVRRQGQSPADAEDLTQAFFAKLLEKHYLQAAEREKGRFRTFLRVALKRFLANEWDRVRSLKRGGGQATVPLDTAIAERLYQAEPSSDLLPADRMFDRRWAMTLLDRTLERLCQEYAAAG